MNEEAGEGQARSPRPGENEEYAISDFIWEKAPTLSRRLTEEGIDLEEIEKKGGEAVKAARKIIEDAMNESQEDKSFSAITRKLSRLLIADPASKDSTESKDSEKSREGAASGGGVGMKGALDFLAGVGQNLTKMIDKSRQYISVEAMRKRLIEKFRDVFVRFLFSQLQNQRIEPIRGETEYVRYSISELDLSGIVMDPEDVKLALQGQTEVSLRVEATPILIHIKKMKWKYKLLSFPYWSGEGICDVHVPTCSLSVDFHLQRISETEAAYRYQEILKRRKEREQKALESRRKAFSVSNKALKRIKARGKSETKVELADIGGGEGDRRKGGTGGEKDKRRHEECKRIDLQQAPSPVSMSDPSTSPLLLSPPTLSNPSTSQSPAVHTDDPCAPGDSSGIPGSIEDESGRMEEQGSGVGGGDEACAVREGKNRPWLVFKQHRIGVREIHLTFETGGGMTTWLYNTVADLWRVEIRVYMEMALNRAIRDYSPVLEDMCNEQIYQHYTLFAGLVPSAQSRGSTANKVGALGGLSNGEADSDETKGEHLPTAMPSLTAVLSAISDLGVPVDQAGVAAEEEI